jgi:hypothetical protein
MGGVDVQIQVFLISALVVGELLASRIGRFYPGETVPGTHWIGSWVGPATGYISCLILVLMSGDMG